MQKDFIEIMADQVQRGETFALITVVAVSGSVPQRVGAKMLVSSTGKRLWGTIGGGSIENIALKEAYTQIKSKTPLMKEYELLEEGEDATGMLCGGKMSLFYDILGVSAKVYIFGAGHICQQLSPLLTSLGFWPIVIDDRIEYLNESFKHPQVVEILTGDIPEIIDTINFGKGCYIIILTYSHDLDEKILKYLLTTRKHEMTSWKYLGMIGSKRKVEEIFTRLESQGISSDLLKIVHSPIGIPIGSQTPTEIAISIAAEIIKVRNKKE